MVIRKEGAMKINIVFHISVLAMMVMIFSMPIVSYAQGNSARDKAIYAATQDAEAAFDERLWYFTGLLFTAGGYFVAHTYYHPVPAVPLLGKSPEYVAFYTDSYRERSRELRSYAARTGCIHGAFVQTCLFGIVMLYTW